MVDTIMTMRDFDAYYTYTNRPVEVGKNKNTNIVLVCGLAVVSAVAIYLLIEKYSKLKMSSLKHSSDEAY